MTLKPAPATVRVATIRANHLSTVIQCTEEGNVDAVAHGLADEKVTVDNSGAE